MSASGLVLVTTSFPVRNDGSEAAGSFVSDLAVELSRKVPVRVVAPGSEDACELWADGVEVFRYTAPAKPLSNLRIWHPGELLAILRVLRSGMKATRAAVQSAPTSRVIALWALPPGLWARRAAQELGIPYSVWTLGSDIWSLGRLPLVRSWLRKVLMSAAECYSDGLQLARDTQAIAGRSVDFLPSARHIEGRRQEPARTVAPYRLLFLGRWHPNKGVDLLFDALDLLSPEDWALVERIEVCGGGPMAPQVQERVATLQGKGLPLVLRGYLDKAAAQEAILRADYLLIPSRIESIPVLFSDAMKLGAPVVSMPVGDLESLVMAEPACGFVADQVTAAAFAAALSLALRSDSSRFASGTAQRAPQFDLSTIASRILGGDGRL